MAKRKGQEQNKPDVTDSESENPQPVPQPPQLSESQTDYKEKLTYSNTISELLGLIGFAINRGGTGENELETFWAYLLPEIREELQAYKDEQYQTLVNGLSSIPDGLIRLDERTGQYQAVDNSDDDGTLDVQVLLDPRNASRVDEMFNRTRNNQPVRQSSILKHDMIRAYVRDGMLPEIIKALQSHDLLMQTRRKTDTGYYTLVHKESEVVERDEDIEGGINEQ